MLEKSFILENLQKVQCCNCGANLAGAKVLPITEAQITWVGHTVCPVCKSQCMVTITPQGNGVLPVNSDLIGIEFKKFIGKKALTFDEVLDLHMALKKESLWNLLHKKEKN